MFSLLTGLVRPTPEADWPRRRGDRVSAPFLRILCCNCSRPVMALTDERPSMDSSAAIRGAADIGGLAVGGHDFASPWEEGTISHLDVMRAWGQPRNSPLLVVADIGPTNRDPLRSLLFWRGWPVDPRGSALGRWLHQWEALGQVVARSAVELDPLAALAGDHPKTVVLDLVQPHFAGGRARG
jgi:hypothetical protein